MANNETKILIYLRNLEALMLQNLTNNEEKEYPLRKVEVKELSSLRNTGVPGFVLKLNSQYYYAEIDDNILLYNQMILGKHMCSNYKGGCKFLYPSQCKKVADYTAAHIENYDWITSGYETFNMAANRTSFVVLSCLHHKELISQEKKVPLKDKKGHMLDLALYLWENCTEGDVLRKVAENCDD